jgi:hypothetical protein
MSGSGSLVAPIGGLTAIEPAIETRGRFARPRA